MATAVPSADVLALTSEILAAQSAVRAAAPTARLFAFWDFDGTLLHGDCSEGLPGVYPGLVQRAIESGFSAIYPAKDGFKDAWNKYRDLEQKAGPEVAYTFLAQIWGGANAGAVAALASDYFASTLECYYFPEARRLFAQLQESGVEQHILSASPEIFVRGAATSLRLPPDNIHGIRVQLNGDQLTSDLVQPVTFAEGKSTRLQEILRAAHALYPTRAAYALAGFGNSVATDGAFLARIQGEALPAARSFAVMIAPSRVAGAPPVHSFRTLALAPPS